VNANTLREWISERPLTEWLAALALARVRAHCEGVPLTPEVIAHQITDQAYESPGAKKHMRAWLETRKAAVA
jgi:hypothetical protein